MEAKAPAEDAKGRDALPPGVRALLGELDALAAAELEDTLDKEHVDVARRERLLWESKALSSTLRDAALAAPRGLARSASAVSVLRPPQPLMPEKYAQFLRAVADAAACAPGSRSPSRAAPLLASSYRLECLMEARAYTAPLRALEERKVGTLAYLFLHYAGTRGAWQRLVMPGIAAAHARFERASVLELAMVLRDVRVYPHPISKQQLLACVAEATGEDAARVTRLLARTLSFREFTAAIDKLGAALSALSRGRSRPLVQLLCLDDQQRLQRRLQALTRSPHGRLLQAAAMGEELRRASQPLQPPLATLRAPTRATRFCEAGPTEEWVHFPGAYLDLGSLALGRARRHRFRLVVTNTAAVRLDLRIDFSQLPFLHARYRPGWLAPGTRRVVEIGLADDAAATAPGERFGFVLLHLTWERALEREFALRVPCFARLVPGDASGPSALIV
jgi:hypothetical protein